MTDTTNTNEPKKAGRPTIFGDDILKRTDEYLNQTFDREVITQREVVSPTGEVTMVEDKKFVVELPSVEGLALFLKVHRDTIYDWAKKHEIFSDTLERISQVQKKNLINNGLSGTYNSTIAKLMLASNHDMRDKSDMTSGGKRLKESTTFIIRDFKETDDEESDNG